MASIKQVFDTSKAHGDNPSGGKINPFGLRPLQILDEKDKDYEWYGRNIDWLEWQGMLQLYSRSFKFLKNYKLAAGILDKTDYVMDTDGSSDPEYNTLLNILLSDYKEDTAMELKFYPILPVVINVLSDEFTKRNIEVTYKCIDEWSISEVLDAKKEQVEQVVKEWIQKIVDSQMKAIAESGQALPQEEIDKIMSQLQEQVMQKFPEIQNYFNRNFKLNVERLAEKFHEYDNLRLKLKEKMYYLFKDFLITGMFICEFRMNEDDYDIIPWNPSTTFFKRSQESQFFSDGEWAGKIELMSLNEVITRFGKYIPEDVILHIQSKYGFTAGSSSYPAGYDPGTNPYYKPGIDTMGSTDVTKTGGIEFEREMYWNYPYWFGGLADVINKLFYSSEDAKSVWHSDLMRVTTVYWKTIKKVGIVTRIDPFTFEKTTFIVDDNYKPAIKPEYDKRLGNSETADNLLTGEHIEWFFIPYVVGGIKIGPNLPTFYKSDKDLPIYIGINSNKPGPIPYQFNDSNNLFSCKLPVEGTIYTERNTQSMSLVDLGKPYQIMYNVVNNQIMDMLLDEIGSVVMLDQNALPKTSLEEDGSSNPLMTAYNYMKKYKILPVDTSLANTQQPITFSQFQQLVLEHSPRLQTRIQLAQYFQTKLFETIGLTPERLGRPTSEYQSGKSSEINVVNSYSSTEKYFKMVGDMFLPRLHEMRTSLLLWYLSNNKMKNEAISYITDKYEREIISNIDKDTLILRKIGVYPTSQIDYKLVLDQIKGMVFNNPNLGLSLTDAVKVIGSNKQSDILTLVQDLERKSIEKARQEQEAVMQQKQMDHQMRLEEISTAAKYQDAMLDKKLALEREKIKASILEAQINSARYMASLDLNENKRSDYMDFLMELNENESRVEQVYNKYIEKIGDLDKKQKMIELKNKEMEQRQKMKEIDLQIAKTYEGKNNKSNQKE